jgi:hypothetical protein
MEFPLARSAGQEEMGPGGLGEGMHTKKQRRPRATGPRNLNQIMGAKIWWRWLKTPDALWAQIWKNKYAPTTQLDQLIRHNIKIQGSNIWNIAWQNKDMIQKHAFWEICNGDSARFWQDSWQ